MAAVTGPRKGIERGKRGDCGFGLGLAGPVWLHALAEYRNRPPRAGMKPRAPDESPTSAGLKVAVEV
ncbi:hypothetical protein [Roseovarius salis]|uniref:hypothetical protein n=1 Tax=Roseovarius salis TaxID=3376063 RepID=UPI0037CBB6F4